MISNFKYIILCSMLGFVACKKNKIEVEEEAEPCSSETIELFSSYTTKERTDTFNLILPAPGQLLIDTSSITSFTIYQNCSGQQFIDTNSVLTLSNNYDVIDLPGNTPSSKSHFGYYPNPNDWPVEVTNYFVVSSSYHLMNITEYGHEVFLLFNEPRDSMAIIALDTLATFQTIVGYK